MSDTQLCLFDDSPPMEKPQISLRPYQEDAIETSIRAYSDGVSRQIVHMATGTGKTVVFCHLMDRVKAPRGHGNKVLVMAHRDELIDQMARSIKMINPHMKVGIEQGARHADPNVDVVVASVPTLGRKDATDPYNYNKRLKQLRADEFKMIAIDEVHHSIADTYTRILNYFGTTREDNQKLLWGCTATPNRSDGRGLGKLFDEIVFSYGIMKAIDEKWLSSLSALRVETETSLSGIKTRLGDWATNELSDRVNNEQRNEQIVQAWKQYCQDKRTSTMCFCVDVKHVYDLITCFREHGIDARGADGTTDKQERRAMVEDFREQKFPVLVNCALWTEGSDFPCMDAIIMARPTKSSTLFTQIVGRGTRLFPGKKDCLVIDMVDASAGKDLMTVPSLFGMDADFDAEGQDVVAVYKKMEKLFEDNPAVKQAKSIKEAEKLVATKIDLFSYGVEDDLIKKNSRFKWRNVNDVYILHLDRHNSLVIDQNMLGSYEIRLHGSGEAQLITKRRDKVGAMYAADNYVKKHFPQVTRLLDRNAGWRDKEMTPSQIELYNKWHIPLRKDDQGNILTSRGEASDEIDKKMAFFKQRYHNKSMSSQNGKKRTIRTKVDNVKVGKI